MARPATLPKTPLLACILACALALFALSGCGAANDSNASASSGSEGSKPATATADNAKEGASVSSGVFPSASSVAASDVPKEDSKLAKKLKSDLKPIVDKSGMDMRVCVIDLASDTRVSIGGDKCMVSASMIKLAVAAGFLELADTGKLSLDDTYTIKDSDIVGGAGSLGGRGAGGEATYAEIFEKMIAESDNTAANILINAVGMKAINENAKKLGLTSTELNRLMMDEDAIAKGKENYMSANDIATILELAYKGELVSPKASKTLIKALKKQTDETGILEGLPSGVTFAHKTGALANAQNDGGIVLTNGKSNDANAPGDFIVAVMAGGNGFAPGHALETMSDIGRAAYRDIVGK